MSGNRFRRVPAADAGAITVRLWRTDPAARGEVVGPDGTGFRAGGDDALSPDQALATGCALANRYGLEVVVMDPDGLWPPRWGSLVG